MGIVDALATCMAKLLSTIPVGGYEVHNRRVLQAEGGGGSNQGPVLEIVIVWVLLWWWLLAGEGESTQRAELGHGEEG